MVLLDRAGRAIGEHDKATVHHADTPLHLAFSCYVFDDDNRLLLTRRAPTKAVFPGVWTNSVCGHPAPGEALADAVRRRADVELGLGLDGVQPVLCDFRYRAEMNGIVENEICPVFVARAVGQPRPWVDEVDAVEWVPWSLFAEQVLAGSRAVSPWCVSQVVELAALGDDPWAWPVGDVSHLPPR